MSPFPTAFCPRANWGWGMLDVSAYVLTIHAPGEGRRPRMETELSRARFEWRFFEGVTVDAPDLWKSYSRFRNLLFYKYPVTAPEMACYLSHRAIWQEIASGQSKAALVFEDDAFITDDQALYRAIRDVAAHLDKIDVVKFYDYRPKAIGLQLDLGATTLVSHRALSASTVSYLITKVGAQKMLTRNRLFRPVDQDWVNAWELDLRILSVHPNPVSTDDEGMSTIQESRKATRRNLLRTAWNEFLTVRRKRLTARYHSRLRLDCQHLGEGFGQAPDASSYRAHHPARQNSTMV